jgi:NAD-dependent deacetylase
MPIFIPPEIGSVLKKRFERIMFFSGAGMSAESGISTFRSGSQGLWNSFNPKYLATPAAWRRDKDMVWAWYEWRRHLVMQARPHAGYAALARLQQALDREAVGIVTQNVDDLHERAGLEGVLHLHGSLFAARCFACTAPHTLDAPPTAHAQRLKPPACARCGGYVRPGVVWFGEMLPQNVVDQATTRLMACDLLLIVGTSGTVYPAASMVNLAPQSATLIEINPHAGPAVEQRPYLHWRTTAAEALPALAHALLGLSP